MPSQTWWQHLMRVVQSEAAALVRAVVPAPDFPAPPSPRSGRVATTPEALPGDGVGHRPPGLSPALAHQLARLPGGASE